MSVKQRLNLTGLQGTLAIAIEPILSAMQLSMVCPKCLAASEPDPFITGNNAPGDHEWVLSCACTQRVVIPASVSSMPASSALLWDAREVFAGARMEVRCGTNHPDCRYQPLRLTLEPEGARTVQCGCARHRIRPTGGAPVGAATSR